MLQAERRVVHTVDPQYPSATLRGSLPALVVHLSEHKLRAVRAVLDAVSIFTTSVSLTLQVRVRYQNTCAICLCIYLDKDECGAQIFSLRDSVTKMELSPGALY